MAASSVYHEYPPSQPFINDDYRRDVRKPIDAYPESNRQGVMSALRNLQQRIKQIELENQLTSSRLADTQRNHAELSTSSRMNPPTRSADLDRVLGESSILSDVHGKLLAQEERCRALEHQLEQTRLLVQQAESERAEALRQVAHVSSDGERPEPISRTFNNAGRNAYSEKIAEMERDHLRLLASQTLANNKIRELEEKLKTEPKEERRIITDELVDELPAEKPPRRRKKRSSSAVRYSTRASRGGAVGRKYPAATTSSTGKLPGAEPPEHYHLNLNQIPFLTGKSTASSHSLSANFQQVLSLMKSHNTKLCAGPQKHSHPNIKRQTVTLQSQRRSVTPCAVDVSDADGGDLSDLLQQLQSEFGQLSREHDDLVRQLKQTTDERLREDLERAVDSLVEHMEAKANQINKLRQINDNLNKRNVGGRKKTRGRPTSVRLSNDRARCVTNLSVDDSRGKVLMSTAKTSSKGQGSLVRPPPSCSKAQGSLNLYKDLKKIQTTLRQDDIMWDG